MNTNAKATQGTQLKNNSTINKFSTNKNLLITDVFNYLFGSTANIGPEFKAAFTKPFVNEDTGEITLNQKPNSSTMLIADIYDYLFGSTANISAEFKAIFPNPVVNEKTGEITLNEDFKIAILLNA